ncbi:hypothetical protein [Halobacillus massiliensis]|uniref:hypothetical protein n=1 Tax=Halobacillus massiliensis TaxID=1926286 RepID=UPI0009E5B776|nr:hypothetical protein [Halobacillus massiliensis]
MAPSTDHYVNQFKSCIMNHLISSASGSTLEETYSNLKKDLLLQETDQQELHSLKKAFAIVQEEIFGQPNRSSIK